MKKLLPTAGCVPSRLYDITRTQPQLYVAPDFEQLFSVLQEVDASLAYRAGGDPALAAALKSDELGDLHFRTTASMIGAAVRPVRSREGGATASRTPRSRLGARRG